MWPIMCNSDFFFRISRLFSDAKKILLYSQNDKSLDGFKELISAVKVMQTTQLVSTELPRMKSSSSCVSKHQMLLFSIKWKYKVTKL